MKIIKISIDVKDGKDDSKEFIIKHSEEISTQEALDFAKEIITKTLDI